jgi:Predicted nucleoside-diphosphate sugar epimerases
MNFSRKKWRGPVLRTGVFVMDMIIAGMAFVAAYAMIYSFSTLRYISGLEDKTLAFILVAAIMYFVFAVHRGSWRYVSLSDMLTIFKAVMASVIVYTVAAFLVSRGDNVPRSVPVLTAILLVGGWAAPRIAYRLAIEGHFPRGLLHRAPRPEKGRRNVLVLGFTNRAESFIRAWLRSGTTDFNILGIVESTPIVNSGSVHGIKIIGTFDDLPAIVESLERRGHTVSELVVAEVSPSRQRLSEIVQIANSVGLRTSRIPELTSPQSIADTAMIETRPIELRDLLGRPEVTTDVSRVAELIEDRVVLTTGAGGSIGSELVLQIAAFRPKRLILADSSEHNTYRLDSVVRQRFPELDIVTRLVDVREQSRLDRLFGEYRPEVVFHAAALKHVPLVEENPIEGIKTNILGTRNAVDAAMAHGASAFIMISTDKAVNPTNVMGATKRAAEAYCQAMDLASEKTRFKTVRFGNVLGSSGSVVPRFQEQIRNGGPVTVTHPNIVRFFMTIPEAVRLVLHASSHALGRKSERGKIMVLDMGDPVRIVDLAERMIQLAGYKPGTDIEIVFTGLRPGEKLYEELFDPSEVQNSETKEGYVIASPRVINKEVLLSTIKRLEAAVADEDVVRALELVRHIVPEYKAAHNAFARSDDDGLDEDAGSNEEKAGRRNETPLP